MDEIQTARMRLEFLYKQFQKASLKLKMLQEDLDEINEQILANENVILKEYGYAQGEKYLEDLEKYMK